MDTFISYIGHARMYYPYENIPHYNRKYWEFQAVNDGKMGASYLHDPKNIEYKEKTLFIAHPNLTYRWQCPENTSVDVIVFQFNDIPDIIKSLCPKDKHYTLPLTDLELNTMISLIDETEPHWEKPTDHSMILFQKIALYYFIFGFKKIKP